MKKLFIKVAVAGLMLMYFTTCFNRLFAQGTAAVSFAVEKTGKGQPVIFIPGLDCSGKVWDDAVAHFKRNFECYTITLPGFAGQPAIKSDSLLNAFTRQLAAYIQLHKLKKPVIIGHSLGGWMALNLAIMYPDLTGDIVCVSSAPFLPALSMGATISVDSARKIGVLIKKGIVSQKTADIGKNQKLYLPSMMRDTAKIPMVAEMAVKSDLQTQGEVMYELFSTDLRPLVGKIQSRILVLGDWSAYKGYGATRESVYNSYKEQFKLAPQVTIAMNDEAKHFIMFDEPAWFYGQVDGFLLGH